MYCNQNMRTVFFSQATTAVPPSSNCPTHQINIESARISTTNIMLALVFISSNHRWYPMLVSKLTWTWKNSLHSFQNHQITVSTRGLAPTKCRKNPSVAARGVPWCLRVPVANVPVASSDTPTRWTHGWWRRALWRKIGAFRPMEVVGCWNQFHTGWLCVCFWMVQNEYHKSNFWFENMFSRLGIYKEVLHILNLKKKTTQQSASSMAVGSCRMTMLSTLRSPTLPRIFVQCPAGIFSGGSSVSFSNKYVSICM